MIPASSELLEIRFTSLNLASSDRARFKYQLEGHQSKWNETEVRMAQFTKLIDAIDTQIAQAAADLNLDSEGFERITSVPGIGLLSGSVLLGLFQRLAQRGADAVIAFLGLDPRPMDSGQKVGQRRLSKRGPAEWRRLLFNAAMSASRTKAWKQHYERERAKGLSRTAALNA